MEPWPVVRARLTCSGQWQEFNEHLQVWVRIPCMDNQTQSYVRSHFRAKKVHVRTELYWGE